MYVLYIQDLQAMGSQCALLIPDSFYKKFPSLPQKKACKEIISVT